jgi:hypothetical protein
LRILNGTSGNMIPELSIGFHIDKMNNYPISYTPTAHIL